MTRHDKSKGHKTGREREKESMWNTRDNERREEIREENKRKGRRKTSDDKKGKAESEGATGRRSEQKRLKLV